MPHSSPFAADSQLPTAHLKRDVLTDSTANLGMHDRIGSGRVRHPDVKWLWTQEAMQAGRFSLKKVGTCSNVSDLTTKHHGKEEWLRYTRGRGDAVSAANGGRTAAVNATLRSQPIEHAPSGNTSI